MKQIKTIRTFFVLFLCLFIEEASVVAATTISQVQSPDQTVKFELLENDAKALCYRVWKGAEVVIDESLLGLSTSVGDFSSGMSFDGATAVPVEQSYSLPSGKFSTYINNYNELTANFSMADQSFQFIARVYNEGVAFRYEVGGSGEITVVSEWSECKVSSLTQVFSQFYERDYKGIVEESDWDRESCRRRSALPLLVQSGNNYLLLSEAMVNGKNASSLFTTNEESRAFVYSPASEATSSLPYSSPWRTIQIGTLASMVESTMMENLNPPTTMTDVSWIKPGRTTSTFVGEDSFGYLSLDIIRSYIDWAAEMGWEYFTLDRGWQSSSAFSLDQVAAYAQSKGVGLILWVNQHKLPTDRAALISLLQGWKNKGVKGIKAEFWESDSQTMMQRYDQLLEATASVKMVVALSSCTKPTGLRRTWPHLLTSEAVLNNSYYASSPAVITASHNINSAIIRSSLGATDYMPTDFADKNGRVNYGNSWAHQLALAVVFESGVQQLSDAPENMKYHLAKDFLKRMPAAWDASLCLEATLGERVTVARRSGDDWYLASLTQERGDLDVSLSFLDGSRSYTAYVYRDGVCRSEIAFEHRLGLRAADRLSLSMMAEGGAVVLLSPNDDYSKPSFLRYEAESTDNLLPFGVTVEADADSLCSGNEYVASLGKGRSVTFRKIRVPQTGAYTMTLFYMSDEERMAYVKINGDELTKREYTFTTTGRSSGRGLGMKNVQLVLEANKDNTIEIGNAYNYAPNIDRIVISSSEGVDLGADESLNGGTGMRVYVEGRYLRLAGEGAIEYQVSNSLGQLLTVGTMVDGGRLRDAFSRGVYLVKLKNDGGEACQKVVVR